MSTTAEFTSPSPDRRAKRLADPEFHGRHAAGYEGVDHKAIEPKVVGATFGAGAAGVVSSFALWVLDTIFWGGPDVAPAVPLPVSGLVLATIPVALTFAGGYFSRHVDRVNNR